MLITLLVLLFVLIALIVYIWYRISEWKRRLKRETKEAEESFHKAFDALKDEVEEQVAKFDGKPGLNAQERKIRDELKNALNIAEDFAGKEIKDIEKELE